MAIRYLNGHILYVGGVIAHADDCCCDECTCPGALPTSYTIDGHILITFTSSHATVYTLCDTDFTITVTGNGVGTECVWTLLGEPLCPSDLVPTDDGFDVSISGNINFELSLDRSPAGVCGWSLLIDFGPCSNRVFKAGGVDPTGGFANVTCSSFVGFDAVASALVVS